MNAVLNAWMNMEFLGPPQNPLICPRTSTNILNLVLPWWSDFKEWHGQPVENADFLITCWGFWFSSSGESAFFKNTTSDGDAYVIWITFSENFLYLLVCEVRHTCSFTDRSHFNFNNNDSKVHSPRGGQIISCAIFFIYILIIRHLLCVWYFAMINNACMDILGIHLERKLKTLH